MIIGELLDYYHEFIILYSGMQINILVRLILLLPPRLLGTFHIIENLAYNEIELNK